jgi:endonuclease VIII
MPEGDTIRLIAARLAPLVGHRPALVGYHARVKLAGIVERLAGRTVTGIGVRGKHLLVAFDQELVLHSHLRMSGAWEVHPVGQAWRRPAWRAFLSLTAAGIEAVEFDGPVLELLTRGQLALHPVISRLGPDVGDELPDVDGAVSRIRRADPAMLIVDVLRDQRLISGIGNVWACEAAFACGVDPFRPVSGVPSRLLRQLIETVAVAMRAQVASGADRRPLAVYGRAGRPCQRCGSPVRFGRGGSDGRVTYWCAGCQR